MKNKRKGKIGLIVWSSVTAFLLVFLIVLTVLENGILNPIFGTILGGKKPIMDDAYAPIYKSDYSSKEASVKAGDELNVKIEQEGAILLMNEDNALPIAKGSKVSVFGKNSVNLVLGGTGSGSISGSGAATLFDGLDAGEIKYNPELKKFYESNASGGGRPKTALKDSTSASPILATGETPIDKYTNEVKKSFKDYSDAAIVIISRLGGESFDLPRTQDMSNGGIQGKHYLQLDKNEYDMLDMVTSRFDKVVVVLNTLTSFQCDFIAEYNNTETNKRIDAVMWIGGPGKTGAKAFGSLLNGEVNPSGRTTDIYSKDFTKDPTWQNFGDNSQVNGNVSNTAFIEGSKETMYNIVTYEEGVYLGYRYYETRAYVEQQKDPTSTWYDDNVMFPFGYGLSYSKFNQTIKNVSGSLEDGGSVSITVEVSHVSGPAGKEVVQLYVTKPYYEYGIEKSHVELVDYAKTEILSSENKTQEFTFKVDAYDLASYDYNDANHINETGYELEAGNYVFYVSQNSHVSEYAYDSVTVSLEEGLSFETDPVTGNRVVNRYTLDNYDDIQYRLSDVWVGDEQRKGMSRTDFVGTFPTPLTEDERKLNGEEKDGYAELDKLQSVKHNNSVIGEVTEIAEIGKSDSSEIVLHDLLQSDGSVSYKDDRWNDILKKVTFSEMLALVNTGDFKTIGIKSIGKNLTNDSDGPSGFVNFMGGAVSAIFSDNTNFATEIVIGSTWNKSLGYEMGKIVGENGLWGDKSGNNNLPYSGWYAPAVNLHRSPFSGRNFEYYSEDPILSGKMAVNVITGARSKGVYADLKHFALNDQETNRAGVSTFCTEQAFRELYLKPFEIAVKGDDDVALVKSAQDDNLTSFKGTIGVMSSFNRIGNKWAGGDYRLLTEILRNEWGFCGLVICDYKTDNSFMDSRQMLYAGNDLILTSTGNCQWTDAKADNAQDVAILQTATKNILYTVANSNSIQIKIVGYKTEWWISLTIALDVIIPVGLAVWGFFAIRKFVKGKKQEEQV